MDLSSNLARSLVKDDEGIWVSDKNESISYPESGNEMSFAVEDNSFWFSHRNKIITKLVELFPASGVIFDVGGGNGYVSKGIADRGFEVALVEPGPSGALNAKKRGLKNVVCATLEEVSLDKESVPAIGIFDVLEHIEDDVSFLKMIADHLEPSGKLYLTVPAYQFLWSYDDEYAGHYRRYTLSGLRKKLISVGLKPEFSTYMFFFLPLPIFLFRCLPTKLGIRKEISTEITIKEHVQSSGIKKIVLDLLLGVESFLVRHKLPVPFGGSCVVVARKVM